MGYVFVQNEKEHRSGGETDRRWQPFDHSKPFTDLNTGRQQTPKTGCYHYAARKTEHNVAIKISGIGLPGEPWTVAANGPVIRDAIAIFGKDRAMFASNFPVDSLVGDFDTIFSGFLAATAAFSESERDQLFHGNAERIYRM